MIREITDKLSDIASICEAHHVKRLDVFGSASRGDDFAPEVSDVDLIVEFDHLPPGTRWDTYWSLKTALEAALGYGVDLIEPGGLNNPYLIRSIQESRNTLYAA